METQKLLIEIDVNASDATQEIIKQRTALGDLKAEVNDLKAANEKLYAQEKVDTDAINANKAAIIQKEGQIKNLTAEMKVNEKVVQSATKNTKDETGAYQKLSLEYQVASQKAKDLAVVHGVNSEQAKKATASAAAMDKQLKEVDKSVGNNQRNVGNYSSALEGMGESFNSLPGPLGNVGGAIGQVSNSMKALLANPVVLVIAGIVAVFMLLKEGLETNREGTERLNQILAPFKNLLQGIMVVIGEVANGLLKGVQAIYNFTMGVLSFIPAIDKMNKANQESMAIEKELQRIRRADIVDAAQDAQVEREIAELKKKMRMKDVYDEKERLAFARKIDQLALADATDDKKRAEDEVQNYLDKKRKEGKSSQTKYTNDELKELADLVVKKEGKMTEYYQKTSRSASMAATLNEELEKDKLKAFQDAQKKREDSDKKALENKKKNQDAELKLIKDNLTIMQNAYKDDYKKSELLDKGYFDKKSAAIEEIYALEITEIEKKKQFGKLTIEEETLARSAADKNKKTALLQLNADLNAEMIKALDESLKLEDIAQKASIIGIVQTEEQKHIATIDGINKRYEAEKKKIELTITDETEKANRLKLLNAQYNLDIKTENQKNDDAIKKQALIDEAELLQSKNEMVHNAIDKEYNSKFDALRKERDERLKLVTEGSAAEQAIRDEYRKKEEELETQKNIEKAKKIAEYAQLASDILGELNNFITALGERELNTFTDKKYQELEIWAQSNKDKEGFEEEYAAKKKIIDEEIEERKAELEYEAAKRNKAMQIVNAIINGAAAVIANLAVLPLAIAAGVMAAAQLATIIATPIPDNRKGGSAGTSGGSITQPTVPNTTPTTQGVINDKTYGSDNVINKQTTNAIENNTGVYVPVLVTNDLTKEYAKQNTVKVTNTMD